jgi:hypothetical protein
MRWKAFGPSFQGQRPILYCTKPESLHFHDKSMNYVEQDIRRGSTFLEIMKHFKLRSSFLNVRLNSTVEGGQSRNKPLAQRVVILLAFLLIRRDICRVQNRLLLFLTPRHVSSTLIPSPKITKAAHLK